MEFEYLLEKINKAEFENEPFSHLYIENFFKKEHFERIVSCDQIHFEESKTTVDVIKNLSEKGYNVQSFPGCTTSVHEYLQKYNQNSFEKNRKGNPVSSYGITFRLSQIHNEFIQRLLSFLNSQLFENCLKSKFEIKNNVDIITAIQKNLSHYEISPHPDVREKALTYLININKDDRSEKEDIHTHLLKFKDEYSYVYDFWEKNEDINRCWVPWDWCETVKLTKHNNSLVVFKPSNDTLHAAKMVYDHTKYQRTQLYGNLMYKQKVVKPPNYGYLLKVKKNENL